MKRLLLTIAFALGLASPAWAQSTATPVLPGSLQTSGCPASSTYCFAPYSNSNPLSVTLSGGGGVGSNVNIAGVNGAAPSLTNPVWIANAEAADTTGTFTNATQTTSVTNSAADGYAAGLISVNGTYATASGVFEASDDGGTTWYSVICARSDGTASETGYTSLTNTNRQWSCPVGGNDSLRVRSTAVATGTVNVRVGISAPPPSSNTVAGTVTAALNTGASTDASGTVTTGGSFQTVFAANAARKGCLIQNPTTATEILSVKVGTQATAFTIPVGGTFNCNAGAFVVSDAITLTAATLGHAFAAVSQ